METQYHVTQAMIIIQLQEHALTRQGMQNATQDLVIQLQQHTMQALQETFQMEVLQLQELAEHLHLIQLHLLHIIVILQHHAPTVHVLEQHIIGHVAEAEAVEQIIMAQHQQIIFIQQQVIL
jgi:hypothetical protein